MTTINKLNYNVSKIRHLCLLLTITLIMSCSSTSHYKMGNSQQQNFDFFELTQVPNSLQNRVWLEKFTISFNGLANALAPQKMLLQTELNDEGISIAAMSFEGLPLAQAQWNSKTQVLKSNNSIAKNFNSKRVIQDLQCVYWPISILKNTLLNGYTVEEEIINNVKIRKFYHNNKMFIKIEQQTNYVNFEQIELGYQIIIERLEDNQLTASTIDEAQ